MPVKEATTRYYIGDKQVTAEEFADHVASLKGAANGSDESDEFEPADPDE